jgi:hypothetical protein
MDVEEKVGLGVAIVDAMCFCEALCIRKKKDRSVLLYIYIPAIIQAASASSIVASRTKMQS